MILTCYGKRQQLINESRANDIIATRTQTELAGNLYLNGFENNCHERL